MCVAAIDYNAYVPWTVQEASHGYVLHNKPLIVQFGRQAEKPAG